MRSCDSLLAARVSLIRRRWHMSFCGAGAVLAVRVLSLERDVPAQVYTRRVLPAAALYAASLWLSYSALLPSSTWSVRMAKAIMHAVVCATVRGSAALQELRATKSECLSRAQGAILGSQHFTMSNAAVGALIAIDVVRVFAVSLTFGA